MNKKIIFNFIYLISLIFIVLISSNTIKFTTSCRFYELYNSYSFYLIAIPLAIAYVIAKILKVNEGIRAIYILTSIIPLFLVGLINENNEKKAIKTSKHIVTKAIVIKNDEQQGDNEVIFSFIYNNSKFTFTRGIDREEAKKLNVGDTTLIRYSVKCVYLNGIYKLYPTKAQLEQCKNDCYLINGKLIPIKKKQRENIK